MPLTGLSKAEHDEACVVYAALLLHDAGVTDLTSEALAKVVAASGNEVDGYWCPIFAKLFKEVDVKELITAVSAPGGGPAPAAPAGGAAPAAAAAAAAPAKEDKKKKEEKEEEVDVGGADLFGGGGAKDGY